MDASTNITKIVAGTSYTIVMAEDGTVPTAPGALLATRRATSRYYPLSLSSTGGGVSKNPQNTAESRVTDRRQQILSTLLRHPNKEPTPRVRGGGI